MPDTKHTCGLPPTLPNTLRSCKIYFSPNQLAGPSIPNISLYGQIWTCPLASLPPILPALGKDSIAGTSGDSKKSGHSLPGLGVSFPRQTCGASLAQGHLLVVGHIHLLKCRTYKPASSPCVRGKNSDPGVKLSHRATPSTIENIPFLVLSPPEGPLCLCHVPPCLVL